MRLTYQDVTDFQLIEALEGAAATLSRWLPLSDEVDALLRKRDEIQARLDGRRRSSEAE